MYYNARYYDPEIGHFISPDTIVPDPLRVDSYNRYQHGLGNPLRYSDPTGHFTEQQLIDWYGEDWTDQFSAVWQKLLLDNPDSAILGARLGDMVVHGNTESILVLNPEGKPALWNIATKSAESVTDVGSSSPSTLGLYRIVGGQTGENGGIFSYRKGGETEFLPATGGGGHGPFTMELLPGYSQEDMAYTASVPGDWFIGDESNGHYVLSHIQFQGFTWSADVALEGGITIAGLISLGANLVPGVGAAATVGGAAKMLNDISEFRPTYEMSECLSIGPNWCQ